MDKSEISKRCQGIWVEALAVDECQLSYVNTSTVDDVMIWWSNFINGSSVSYEQVFRRFVDAMQMAVSKPAGCCSVMAKVNRVFQGTATSPSKLLVQLRFPVTGCRPRASPLHKDKKFRIEKYISATESHVLKGIKLKQAYPIGTYVYCELLPPPTNLCSLRPNPSILTPFPYGRIELGKMPFYSRVCFNPWSEREKKKQTSAPPQSIATQVVRSRAQHNPQATENLARKLGASLDLYVLSGERRGNDHRHSLSALVQLQNTRYCDTLARKATVALKARDVVEGRIDAMRYVNASLDVQDQHARSLMLRGVVRTQCQAFDDGVADFRLALDIVNKEAAAVATMRPGQLETLGTLRHDIIDYLSKAFILQAAAYFFDEKLESCRESLRAAIEMLRVELKRLNAPLPNTPYSSTTDHELRHDQIRLYERKKDEMHQWLVERLNVVAVSDARRRVDGLTKRLGADGLADNSRLLQSFVQFYLKRDVEQDDEREGNNDNSSASARSDQRRDRRTDEGHYPRSSDSKRDVQGRLEDRRCRQWEQKKSAYGERYGYSSRRSRSRSRSRERERERSRDEGRRSSNERRKERATQRLKKLEMFFSDLKK